MNGIRRVSLMFLAASLLGTPLAFAQAQPAQPGAGGGTGGARAGAAADDDEEEDGPAANRPAAGGAAGGAAAGGGGAAASGGPGAPAAGASAGAATPPPAAGAAPAPGAQAPLPYDFADNESEEQSEARRDRMQSRYSSLDGPIGLLHMYTAENGSQGSFRFGFTGYGYSGGSFLRSMTNPNTMDTVNDSASRIGGNLALSFTPWRYLEIFGSIRAYATSNDTERPSLFQVLGDANLGAKGVIPLMRGLTLAASAQVVLLNRSGGIGVSGGSTSADFRLMTSFDLAHYVRAVPLRFTLNLGYYLDNSAQIVADVEARRQMNTTGYDATVCGNPDSSPMPGSPWSNNLACHVLISRQERYALGINRTDRFNVGIGIDARFPWVQPFLEWNVGVAVARQNFICLDSSTGPGDNDGCLAGNSRVNPMNPLDRFAAAPSTFTLGARVVPAVNLLRGLSAMLAVDIATSGTQVFVRELAPNTPWMFYGQLAFAHDLLPRVQRIDRHVEVTRNVEVDRSPLRGAVIGQVNDAETHQGIAHVVIDVENHPEFGHFGSSPAGAYRTRELPPGQYRLHLHANEYNDGTCDVTVPNPPEGQRVAPDTTVNCELAPLPRVGNIQGRVVNAQNQPVAGVTVTGTPLNVPTVAGREAPHPVTATTGADGAFRFEGVGAGTWSVVAGQSANSTASGPSNADVQGRQTAQIELHVGVVQALRVVGGRVDLRAIHFENDQAAILPDSSQILDNVADQIQRHPEWTQLEIQGHTDNQGAPAHNLELSQRRADAVRQGLIERGVAADRLVAHGFGQTRPIASNLTPVGRTRNRRVELVIPRPGARPAGAAGGAARPAGAPAGGAARPAGGAARPGG